MSFEFIFDTKFIEDDNTFFPVVFVQENLFETSTEPLEGEEHEPQPVTPPPKEHSAPKAASSAGTSTPIGELTDRQMLKDILSGDYCLQGVSKYSFERESVSERMCVCI